MKRSNPGRSTPSEPSRAVGIDYETGEAKRTKRTKRTKRQQAQSRSKVRVMGSNGPLPTSGLAPRPSPILMLYDDLIEELGPEPVYGQYPAGLIAKILPWLRCERREVLHLCSGSQPHGEGLRVDIRPAARPDILADARALPLRDASVPAAMCDPPYSAHYARELYGVEYPRPSHLLREMTRVVRPGGRIALVHYITAQPVAGMRHVRTFGVSTGFDMPMRACTVYERDQAELALGVSS